MNMQLQYKLAKFVSEIQSRIEKSQILLGVVQFLNGVWVLIFILELASLNSCAKTSVCSSLKNFSQKYLVTSSFLQINCFSFVASNVILLILVLLYSSISQNFMKIAKYKGQEKIIIFISSICFWVSEILIFPALYYLYLLASSKQLIGAIILGLVIYPGFFFINGSISNYSLYRKSTLIIVPLLWNFGNPYAYVIVAIITIFKFLKTNNKFTKIIFSPIISSLLSNIWAVLVGDYLGLNPFKTSVYLGVLTMLMIFYVLYFSETKPNQSKQFFQNIINKTQALPSDQKIKDYFKTDQVLYIIKFIEQKIRQFDVKLSSNILFELPLQVKVTDLHLILLEVLNKISSAEDGYYIKFCVIRLMISIKKPIFSIMLYIQVNQINITKMNKTEKFQYVRLFQHLKHNYGSFHHSTELQVTQIQETNAIINNFEQKIKKLGKLQIQFWKIISKQKIQRALIEQKYSQIKKLSCQLKISKSKLQTTFYSQRLLKICEIFQKDLDQYSELEIDKQHQTDNLSSQRSARQHYSQILAEDSQLELNQILNNKFIVINNFKVDFISQTLASELKISKDHYKQLQCQELFGDKISQLIHEKINYLTIQNQEQRFYIPFFQQNNIFIPSTGKLLWYPTLDEKNIKYLIQIKTLTQSSYLFYSIKSKMISYYNAHFLLSYCLSQQLINTQIQRQQFSFQRLFFTSFQFVFLKPTNFKNSKKQSYQSKEQMQKNVSYQQSNIPMEINFKGLFKNIKFNQYRTLHQLQIFLKIQDIININSNKFAVLEIQVIRQKSNQILFKKSENQLSLPQSQTIQKSLKDVHENQTFFCPISNSYQSKINQKVSSIKNKYRFRNFMWLVIIGFILVSVSIGFNIFDYFQFEKRNTNYSQIQDSITKGSEQYILLFKMYKSSLKRYQVLAYPENVAKARGKPASAVIASTVKNQNLYLGQFIQTYLDTYRNQPNNVINYNLTFDLFNISTSTNHSTLMDFGYNFRENLDENEYDFILKNYLSLRKLSIQFQKAINNDLKMTSEVLYSIVGNYLFIFVIISLFIVMILASVKNQRNISHILQIYKKIQQKEVQQKINQIKENFKLCFNMQVSQQSSQQSSLQSSQQSNQPSISNENDQLNSQKQNLSSRRLSISLNYLKSVDSKFQSVSPAQICLHSINSQQPQQKAKRTQNRKLKKIIKLRPETDQRRSIIISFMRYNLKYVGYLILMAVYCICLEYNIINLNTQNNKMLDLFEFQKEIYDGVFNLNRMSCDSTIRPVYRHKYNQNISIPTSSTLKINILFQPKSQFKQIYSVEQKIRSDMDGSICSYPISAATLEMIPCPKYGKGALTRGYSQSYAYMLDLVEELKAYNLSQYQTQKCTTDYCPPYYEFDYMSLKLNSVAEYQYSQFQNIFKKQSDKLASQRQYELVMKLLLSLSVFVILGVYVMMEIKHSLKAIELFKIFPKNVICKTRITNYIRKNKILEVLGKI